MAKTKPTGVRFDQELLDTIRKKDKTITAQKALTMYEDAYREKLTLVNDLSKPNRIIKPMEQPKSNYTINTKQPNRESDFLKRRRESKSSKK